MHRLRPFSALALCALLIMLALTVSHPPPAVQADHGLDQDDDESEAIEPEERSNLFEFAALNRNLIFGEAIRVCTMYPNATQAAIDNWQNALRGAGYIAQDTSVFNVEFSNSNESRVVDECTPAETTTTPAVPTRILEDRVKVEALIIVERDPYGDSFCGAPYFSACLFTADAKSHYDDRDYHAFHGIHYIYFNMETYGTETDATGHANYETLVGIMTHELGHMLGFAHWVIEGKEQNFTSVMTSGEFGAVGDGVTRRTNGIQPLDLHAYENAYRPTPLDDTVNSFSIAPHDTKGRFTASFTTHNIHNFQRFDIMRGEPATTDGEEIVWHDVWRIPADSLDYGVHQSGPAGFEVPRLQQRHTIGVRTWSHAYIKDPVVVHGLEVHQSHLATDEAPEFAADASPFTARFTVGVEGSTALPRATGGNGDLTYSLEPTLTTPTVPAWLTFTVAEGVPTITGTPTAPETAALTLTVHDEDDNDASSDEDTVTITIAVGCPTGQTLQGGRCVDVPICRGGKVLVNGQCQCPTGTQENAAGTCVVPPTATPDPGDDDDDDEPTATATTEPTTEACPDGKVREGDSCVCPSGTEEFGEMCLAPCTGGKERDANGACVCPSGTEENAAGTCAVPTYSWSGWCYDHEGTTGGGAGLSQADANAAGQSFKAACRPGGVTTSLTGTTYWYATVTCNGGNSFTLGPFSTSGAADTAGGLGVSTCGLGRLRFTLPTDGPLTLAQVRAALAAALSELSAPLTLDDLTPPKIPERETADPPGRAGRFSTRVAGDGQYADVTCENGTAFTVGPAATLEAVLADGLLGLKVCANGEALAEMSLPQSGIVTRAQLEAAITAALAALPTPLTMADLESPPSGTNSASRRSVQARNGTFSTWSSTSWSWTANCNAGGGSGAGSANTESAAVNAIQLWAGAANCPRGGGDYSVSRD